MDKIFDDCQNEIFNSARALKKIETRKELFQALIDFEIMLDEQSEKLKQSVFSRPLVKNQTKLPPGEKMQDGSVILPALEMNPSPSIRKQLKQVYLRRG